MIAAHSVSRLSQPGCEWRPEPSVEPPSVLPRAMKQNPVQSNTQVQFCPCVNFALSKLLRNLARSIGGVKKEHIPWQKQNRATK